MELAPANLEAWRIWAEADWLGSLSVRPPQLHTAYEADALQRKLLLIAEMIQAWRRSNKG